MILVDEDAVWVRLDGMGEIDFVNPDFHWWQMDGGSWLIDPLPWSQLETESWVQLAWVEPKQNPELGEC